MRHRKKTIKLGRTTSHRRCMMANMLKSLIYHGRMTTTVAKAKVLRSYADKMITLAKKNTLASRRRAIAKMMISFNPLTPKEARKAREGNLDAYNEDRHVMNILFNDLADRFAQRNGGYTRIIKGSNRVGDNAQTCVIEYLEN
ncbi:MAG: 50S ribosomal protein L17 [Chlamydiae bacterium]|nr:50S ribosomal protein L17 [Chlamydiota bacterium]